MKHIVSVLLVLSLTRLAGAVTLEECIRTALASNPDYASARQRVEAARYAVDRAGAAYLPKVTLGTAYTRTDNAPQAFMMTLNQRALDMTADFNNPEDTDNLRVNAGVQYKLYDGGRRKSDKQMSLAGAEAQGYRRDAVVNHLVHEVTRAYYAVLQAHAVTEVQEHTMDSLEESLRIARERFAAGAVVKTDVLNLEVRLAQAEEDLIRASNGVQLALVALNTALGTSLVQGVSDLKPVDASTLAAPPAPPGEDPLRRPELQAARSRVRASEQAWRKARRAYVPSVNFFGSMDFDSEASSDFEDSYFVGVAASWDVFDGGNRPGAVREARAGWKATQAEESSLFNRLKLELKQAYLGTQEAWKRVKVTRKTVESANEALENTLRQYEGGASNIAELLNAQVGLTASRTRTVVAQYDYLTSLSNLARAQGKLAARFKDHAKYLQEERGDRRHE